MTINPKRVTIESEQWFGDVRACTESRAWRELERAGEWCGQIAGR